MLTLEFPDALPVAVMRVRHTATPAIPDRWDIRLRPPAPDPLPAPGTLVTLNGPGEAASVVLRVLKATVDLPAGRGTVVASRLTAEVLTRPVTGCIEGLLPAVIARLAPTPPPETKEPAAVTLTTAARRSVQHVRVALCPPQPWREAGGLTVGALVRRLVWMLAAERGIPLRLKPTASGSLLLTLPHDDFDDTPDEDGHRRRKSCGHADPFAGRGAGVTRRDYWTAPLANGPADWIPAADRTACAGDRLVTRFRASWAAPGAHVAGGSVRFSRETVDVVCWVAAVRARWRGSAWTGIARFGPNQKKPIDNELGDFYEVEPLGWGRGLLAPVPLGKLAARLSVPYAGESDKACGWHTVPKEGSLVCVGAPSAFDIPVVLGNLRKFPVNRSDFGLYLPTGHTWRHHSAELYVRADSLFDPPEE